MSLAYERIYSTVKRVPKGRVATYGQIAMVAGLPGQPRQVGYALHGLKSTQSIPWHRVINAKGDISRRAWPGCEKNQRELLEREGIEFDPNGRVSLTRFLWRPRSFQKPIITKKRLKLT